MIFLKRCISALSKLSVISSFLNTFCCQFQWAGTLCSVLAHSCIPWTLGGDLLSAVTWCWWSNGRDDPVETGVVPPWIFPICCVQGVEHYLGALEQERDQTNSVTKDIGINRGIKRREAKDNAFEKVLNNYGSLKLQYAIWPVGVKKVQIKLTTSLLKVPCGVFDH